MPVTKPVFIVFLYQFGFTKIETYLIDMWMTKFQNLMLTRDPFKEEMELVYICNWLCTHNLCRFLRIGQNVDTVNSITCLRQE